jgi:hypothetical protein
MLEEKSRHHSALEISKGSDSLPRCNAKRVLVAGRKEENSTVMKIPAPSRMRREARVNGEISI